MQKALRRTITADEIAEKASRGQDVSRYFDNRFAVVRPKLYVFYTSIGKQGYDFVALAQDGTCVSTWHAASEQAARAEASERYRNSHDLVWRGGPFNGDTVPGLAPISGSRTEFFIEGHVYAEFLRVLTI